MLHMTAYHVGWQAGFIDDTQPEPAERHETIMEALEKLKSTIDDEHRIQLQEVQNEVHTRT